MFLVSSQVGLCAELNSKLAPSPSPTSASDTASECAFQLPFAISLVPVSSLNLNSSSAEKSVDLCVLRVHLTLWNHDAIVNDDD